MKRSLLILLAALGSACSSAATSADTAHPAPNPAPWSHRALTRAEVPAAYFATWNAAANKSTCALIAFANTSLVSGATARTASFSGGWGVAYDRADQRSAFGIAGTGSAASDTTYEWPSNIGWADGSRASYGPEGGTGPNQLAYLRIRGQDCLYNVWSRVSREHLEKLLESIRFVGITR
jgi:hypothetical protein